MSSYNVRAYFDGATQVWWTGEDDIRGLTCEAESFDALIEKVRDLAPKLLHSQGLERPGAIVEVKLLGEAHLATRCPTTHGAKRRAPALPSRQRS
jgi:hypothetical protein